MRRWCGMRRRRPGDRTIRQADFLFPTETGIQLGDRLGFRGRRGKAVDLRQLRKESRTVVFRIGTPGQFVGLVRKCQEPGVGGVTVLLRILRQLEDGWLGLRADSRTWWGRRNRWFAVRWRGDMESEGGRLAGQRAQGGRFRSDRREDRRQRGLVARIIGATTVSTAGFELHARALSTPGDALTTGCGLAEGFRRSRSQIGRRQDL